MGHIVGWRSICRRGSPCTLWGRPRLVRTVSSTSIGKPIATVDAFCLQVRILPVTVAYRTVTRYTNSSPYERPSSPYQVLPCPALGALNVVRGQV